LSMRHIPHPLGKKLDRLSRRAHRFHRFAHHPLCAAYAEELVPLGRKTRVCRGCALALGGAALGGLLGLSGADGAEISVSGLGLLALVVALLAAFGLLAWLFARVHPAGSRPGKLVTRGLPLFGLCFAGTTGLRLGGLAGLGLLALCVAAAGLAYAWYRRRGPNRSPCAVCPERSALAVCSGFAPIVRRERAFARLARRLLSQVDNDRGTDAEAVGPLMQESSASSAT
jgi:hypothetical protein